MLKMSHLIQGTEEMLISSWRSQVTRAEELVEKLQYDLQSPAMASMGLSTAGTGFLDVVKVSMHGLRIIAAFNNGIKFVLFSSVLTLLRHLSPVAIWSWCRWHPVFSTFTCFIAFIVTILMSLTFFVGEMSQTHKVINGVASQSGVSYFLGPLGAINSCFTGMFTKWILLTRQSVFHGLL